VVIQIFSKIFSGTRKGSTPREQGKGGWERMEVAFSESGGDGTLLILPWNIYISEETSQMARPARNAQHHPSLLVATNNADKLIAPALLDLEAKKQDAIRELPYSAPQSLSLLVATCSLRSELVGRPCGPRQFACKHNNMT
ncbi:hypothetical protein DBR06_SOUSAS3810029, partial [Sousa chinensis]